MTIWSPNGITRSGSPNPMPWVADGRRHNLQLHLVKLEWKIWHGTSKRQGLKQVVALYHKRNYIEERETTARILLDVFWIVFCFTCDLIFSYGWLAGVCKTERELDHNTKLSTSIYSICGTSLRFRRELSSRLWALGFALYSISRLPHLLLSDIRPGIYTCHSRSLLSKVNCQ